jgi:hypothetical protein
MAAGLEVAGGWPVSEAAALAAVLSAAAVTSER